MKSFFITLALLILSNYTCHAADNRVEKRIGDWYVSIIPSKGSNKCYTYTFPYRTKLDDVARDDPYLMIEYKGENRYMVSLSAGLNIHEKAKEGSIAIGDNIYNLDIKKSGMAWTFSEGQDVAIINNIIKSDGSLLMYWNGMQNPKAIDYYSLTDFFIVSQYLRRQKCS